jgi:ubiquinone/menaquinone biosynthesis C-methylase UbiE
MEASRLADASIVRPADGPGNADAVRSQLHGMWSSVAPGWEEHAAFVDARAGAITERLLQLARLAPGDRVLELACGAGGLGLAAAERVAPNGEVVLSDVAPEMTAIARRRADALGVDVRTRVLDLEAIDEPNDSYDAVLCREGLMLVPDPARAVGEITRVLRPGGRIALAVWGPRARNPWLGVVFDAAGAELGAPVPPPGVPGPFSLDDADRLVQLLGDAGLVHVEAGEVPAPYRATSAEEWWSRTIALSGPLGQRLAALPEPSARAVFERARAAISEYETPVGLDIPGVSLVAGATRP